MLSLSQPALHVLIEAVTVAPACGQVNTAAMKVEVSILGMRPPPRTVSALQSTSAAVLAPGGGELVLPTDNSMLQFWDAARDRHVNRLQVPHVLLIHLGKLLCHTFHDTSCCTCKEF